MGSRSGSGSRWTWSRGGRWIPPDRRLALGALLAGACLLAAPQASRAMCDVIPQAKPAIRGSLGSVDRPYATPGSTLSVTLDRAGCDAAAAANPGAQQVSVFYLAPDGAVNVVTTNAFGVQAAQCALPGGGQHLFGVDGLLAGNFGDTLDFELLALGGFAGPVRIAVQPYGNPPPAVPCALATTRCADYTGPALLACVDELYEDDGTCSQKPSSRNPLFPSFTALPPENFFRDLCTPTPEAPACTGTLPDLQLALDAEGNLLLPVNYTDIETEGALPVPRFVSGRTTVEAFPGGGTPPDLPGPAFYDSFSPSGRLLPPYFRDVEDPADPLAAGFLGTVDAERGVIRFLRRSPFRRECLDEVGGAVLGGLPCAVDDDCPSGAFCGTAVCYASGTPTSQRCGSDADCASGEECGPSLFDFSTRLSLSGAGPLRIPGSDYVAEAQNEVPLDCLFETDDVIVACRSEVAEGVDLNGDTDTVDTTVVSLRDRASGAVIPIGAGGAPGIAATRARKGAFSDPSIEVEGDVVAFLQPEGGATPMPTDENADGDFEDALLRVIRLQPGSFTDLVAPGTLEAAADPVVNDRSLTFQDGLVFFRRSEFDGTPQTSFLTGTEADPVASPVRTTPDGRFVVFSRRSDDTFAFEPLQVVDRDPDENGILDDTSPVVDATPFAAWNGSISDDGRHVVFQTTVDVPGTSPWGDVGGDLDVFVWDRQLDSYLRLSLQRFFGFQTEFDGDSTSPQISSSGRYVAFLSDASNVAGDLNGAGIDLFLVDRDPDQDGIFDENDFLSGLINAVRVNTDGGAGGSGEVREFVNQAFDISRDERWIVFTTDAFDYPGVTDTNGAPDVYARELDPQTGDFLGTPFRLSIRTATDEGAPSEFESFANWIPTISGDGRLVAFVTADLIFPDVDPVGLRRLVIVRDRDADGNGVYDEPEDDGTPRFALHAFGIENAWKLDGLSLSPEGRFLLVGLDTADDVNQQQAWRLIDLARGEAVGQRIEPKASFNPDGERPLAEDRLFRSIEDLSSLGPCCPTIYFGRVTGLDGSNVANDVNADGLADDDVLTVVDTRVDPAQVVTLEPAEEVRVEGGNAVFLVREADVGVGGTDLNGDTDVGDEVVFVWEAGAPGAPANAAVNQQLAATDVAIGGTALAALVPQPGGARHLHVAQLPAPGPGSWTDTGIAADQLAATPAGISVRRTDGALEVLDPATLASLATVAGPVREFVADGALVAFRREETTASLNGDADTDDAVLQVLEVPTATVLDSGQAAIPCPYEACDPSAPYRIAGQVVRFLTREADQGGGDLDGDGATNGVVLQTYNVAAARVDAYPTATRGLCTDTGDGCNVDADCAAGTCFTPPGGCVRDLGTVCDPDANQPCAIGQFCQPIPGASTGTCFERFGSCDTDAECTLVDPVAFCVDDAQEQRPPDPLALQTQAGALAYLSRGVCVDGGGSETGTCRTQADCPAGSTCELGLVFGASADADGDGVADVADVCESVFDPGQADADGDGVGDACDRQTCGNGVQEYTETCDDGNTSAGDGCSAACQLEDATPACSNGRDDDGDGRIDFVGGDLGCADALDTSERSAAYPCDDGEDDDGDYRVDFPADPGCKLASYVTESPECQDGINNDGVLGTDFDGGESILGVGNGDPDGADPQCTDASVNQERSKRRCGLGFEVVPVLLGLGALAGRRRRARR